MDIIGPLPQTFTGKQYVLVISDYETRYTEVHALRNVTAISVAEKLVNLISRHREPKDVLADQGTNFFVPRLNLVR